MKLNEEEYEKNIKILENKLNEKENKINETENKVKLNKEEYDKLIRYSNLKNYFFNSKTVKFLNNLF